MTRWTRFIAVDRLADLVLTALMLNLFTAAVRGRFLLPSAALLVAWVGGRFIVRRRGGLASATGAWLRSHVQEVIVVALFVVGLTLRLWGISFGSPLILHPDEPVLVSVPVSMLKSGWIAPRTPYHYPTVFPYILLPAFGLLYVRGKSAGVWTDLDDITTRPFEFYELARAHSAVLGALTILLTYVAARQMWAGQRGRWIGVVAATYVTFSFNHVKESHFAVTDVPLTFFIVVAFLAILRAFRRGSTRAYVLAGFAIGIACATKYSAVPLVVVLVVAHFVDSSRAWSHLRRLPAGLIAIPVGFFTGYPYALLNWPPFLEHLGWMSSFARRDFDTPARFARIVGHSADSGFGLPFTLVFGAAFVYAVHRRKAEEILAITFIVVSLVLLSNSAMPFFLRYLVPIVPFAALIVGGFLLASADWLTRVRKAAAFVPLALTALVLVLVWPPAYESFQFAVYTSLPDTRVLAYRYIVERFPPGTTIASEVPMLRLPPGYRLLTWSPLHERSVEDFVNERVDVLVFSDARSSSTRDPLRRGDLQRRFPLEAAFPNEGRASVGPTISIYLGPHALP